MCVCVYVTDFPGTSFQTVFSSYDSNTNNNGNDNDDNVYDNVTAADTLPVDLWAVSGWREGERENRENRYRNWRNSKCISITRAAYTINSVTISFPRCLFGGGDDKPTGVTVTTTKFLRRTDGSTTIRRQQLYGFSSRIPSSSGQCRRNN